MGVIPPSFLARVTEDEVAITIDGGKVQVGRGVGWEGEVYDDQKFRFIQVVFEISDTQAKISNGK